MKEKLYEICEEILSSEEETKKFASYETLEELYEYFLNKLPNLTKDEFEEFICEALDNYAKEKENITKIGNDDIDTVSGGANLKQKFTAGMLGLMSMLTAVPGVGAANGSNVGTPSGVSETKSIKTKISETFGRVKNWVKKHPKLTAGITVGAVILAGVGAFLKIRSDKKNTADNAIGNVGQRGVTPDAPPAPAAPAASSAKPAPPAPAAPTAPGAPSTPADPAASATTAASAATDALMSRLNYIQRHVGGGEDEDDEVKYETIINSAKEAIKHGKLLEAFSEQMKSILESFEGTFRDLGYKALLNEAKEIRGGNKYSEIIEKAKEEIAKASKKDGKYEYQAEELDSKADKLKENAITLLGRFRNKIRNEFVRNGEKNLKEAYEKLEEALNAAQKKAEEYAEEYSQCYGVENKKEHLDELKKQLDQSVKSLDEAAKKLLAQCRNIIAEKQKRIKTKPQPQPQPAPRDSSANLIQEIARGKELKHVEQNQGDPSKGAPNDQGATATLRNILPGPNKKTDGKPNLYGCPEENEWEDEQNIEIYDEEKEYKYLIIAKNEEDAGKIYKRLVDENNPQGKKLFKYHISNKKLEELKPKEEIDNNYYILEAENEQEAQSIINEMIEKKK